MLEPEEFVIRNRRKLRVVRLPFGLAVDTETRRNISYDLKWRLITLDESMRPDVKREYFDAAVARLAWCGEGVIPDDGCNQPLLIVQQ
jgi:hypothetical protein